MRQTDSTVQRANRAILPFRRDREAKESGEVEWKGQREREGERRERLAKKRYLRIGRRETVKYGQKSG
jgi:hypothetical protein